MAVSNGAPYTAGDGCMLWNTVVKINLGLSRVSYVSVYLVSILRQLYQRPWQQLHRRNFFMPKTLH